MTSNLVDGTSLLVNAGECSVHVSFNTFRGKILLFLGVANYVNDKETKIHGSIQLLQACECCLSV